MTDLTSRYLGLELRSPLVASASPLTGNLDGLRRLEEAGAGAVVLPSLFQEQLEHESAEIDRLLATGAEHYAEALGYFPELQDYNTGPDEYLSLIETATYELSIPVIASLNGTTVGGWTRHAQLIESAGADALELNIYYVAANHSESPAQIEEQYLELVSGVRSATKLPLAVKLGPYFTSLPYMARAIVAAGADGLVLFNRFYQPDIDLESFDVVPRLELSTPGELRLPLRWIAILRDQIHASIAATTGVHDAEAVLKVLLAGADVAMMASCLLRHGIEYLGRIEADVRNWLEEHSYATVSELRGSMSQRSVPNPAGFERANYMHALTSYSTRP